MSSAPEPTLTTDEFLPWAEAQGGRWELHDGVAVMMAPERVANVRTKAAAHRAMADAMAKAGLSCEAYADGLSVKVDAGAIFEPDASVVCGPRRPEGAVCRRRTHPVRKSRPRRP